MNYMKRTIVLALCLAGFCVTQAQSYEEYEIVTDDQGQQQEIGLPESMTVDIDDLLDQYHTKAYMQTNACNMRNDDPETEKEVFLIVSRPQFREGLQSFVQWKRQEGFDVEELVAGDIGCTVKLKDLRAGTGDIRIAVGTEIPASHRICPEPQSCFTRWRNGIVAVYAGNR